ncbi:hypothetical protein CDD83_2532 [Cordyceps sp. RAO-2017]|nr:hypothetical protein CDD83_2532 [Cordyceps sp. RAO-2017]
MGVATVLAPAAVLAVAAANFLDAFTGTSDPELWRAKGGDTMVRISDLGVVWPLDLPPWQFAALVTGELAPAAGRDHDNGNRSACNEHRCWHAELAVPGVVLPAGGGRPRHGNVSVTVEGVFDPDRGCCSRGTLVAMLARLLRSEYDPVRTPFLKVRTQDHARKPGRIDYRPVYQGPQAIGVGIGFSPTKYWLNLKISSDPELAEARPRTGWCDHFKNRALKQFDVDLHSFRDPHKLGFVRCLWKGSAHEPPLRLGYKSPGAAPREEPGIKTDGAANLTTAGVSSATHPSGTASAGVSSAAHSSGTASTGVSSAAHSSGTASAGVSSAAQSSGTASTGVSSAAYPSGPATAGVLSATRPAGTATAGGK